MRPLANVFALDIKTFCLKQRCSPEKKGLDPFATATLNIGTVSAKTRRMESLRRPAFPLQIRRPLLKNFEMFLKQAGERPGARGHTVGDP